MDKLLNRFILNDKRRVERAAKLGMDVSLFGIEKVLSELLEAIPYNAYPIPATVLNEVFPQYSSIWEVLPTLLTVEEENYARAKYHDLIANGITFAMLAKKKDDRQYYKELNLELNKLEDELKVSFEIETEFDTMNMDEFTESDEETLSNIIPTPFPRLTEQIKGGFLPGRIYSFMGRAKASKTMLMIYFSIFWARMGKKVMYISNELYDLEFRERLGHIIRGYLNPMVITKLDWGDYPREDKEKIFNELKSYPGKIMFKAFACPNMRQIEQYVSGYDYDILIIDHASKGRMIPNFKSKDEKTWEEEEKIFNDIYTFARKSQKTILVPTFLNRAGEENIKKFGNVESFHTGGAISKNAIVDALYAILPQPITKDEFGRDKQLLFLQPVALRRGSGHEQIQLETNFVNGQFHEAITAESVNRVNESGTNSALRDKDEKGYFRKSEPNMNRDLKKAEKEAKDE
jgi:hypothetical protein